MEKIREDFPILKREINGLPLVYLDSAATSQKPRQVLEAVVNYYERHNANIHRGVHTLSVEATEMVDCAREKVASFIGVTKVSEVIFVRNATEGINLVMRSYGEANIGRGDVVVVSVLEHHANLVTWQELVKKIGAELRVVDVNEEGGLDYEDLGRKLDGRVKLLALTAVSNVLGSVVDLDRVVNQVRQKARGAKILVDGSQLVPHKRVDVSKLGADFLVFSGHKMLGPTGTGVLWGREEILNKMPPFLFGGDMISEVKLDGASWNKLPYKFEAGTPDIAGIVGLGAAVDYLRDLGMENVYKHDKEMMAYAMERFLEYESRGIVKVYGPRNVEERLAVIAFNVNGVHAHDTAQILDKYGIAVRSGQHCAGPLTERMGEMATVRVSFYVYTTKKEIDYLLEKIMEVLKVFRV